MFQKTLGYKKDYIDSQKDAENAKLVLMPLNEGEYGIDMVSLFHKKHLRTEKMVCGQI